jgi:hypothetical protein
VEESIPNPKVTPVLEEKEKSNEIICIVSEVNAP